MSTCIYCGGRSESCYWCFGTGKCRRYRAGVRNARSKGRNSSKRRRNAARRARNVVEPRPTLTPQAKELYLAVVAAAKERRAQRGRQPQLPLRVWHPAARQ
jgi:hypothetical protein